MPRIAPSVPPSASTGEKAAETNNRPIALYFSAYDALYAQLRILEQRNIFSSTGCYKPCTYREYRFIGDGHTSSSGAEDFLFSLWAVSNDTTVEREVLIFLWTSSSLSSSS